MGQDRNYWKKLLPFIKAYADGKEVFICGKKGHRFDDSSFGYCPAEDLRICNKKKKKTYRLVETGE